MNVIRFFRGTVDFYYWKGIAVARKWPRAPQQPNSGGQLAARAAFALAIRTIRDQPPAWHDAWKNVAPPKMRSLTDLKRKSTMRLINSGDWAEPPIVLGSMYLTIPGQPSDYIIVRLAPYKDTSQAYLIKWKYRPATQGRALITWKQEQLEATREHFIKFHPVPDLDGFLYPISQTFSLQRYTWTLAIPFGHNALTVIPFPLSHHD
jgi:hypothetical protein